MLKWTRRTLFTALLVFSLALNVGVVLSSAVFSVVSSAAQTLTGLRNPILKQADEARELSRTLDQQRLVNRELRGDLAEAQADVVLERQTQRELRNELAEAQANILLERQAKRELRDELTEATAQLAASRAAHARLRTSATAIADRVGQRASRFAKREVAAAAGESIPFWGIGVIAAVTALELNDLCQTAKDMNELQALFDPTATASEEALTACGYEVPPKSVLVEGALQAPGRAWSATREAIPTLEDMNDFELPDFSAPELTDTLSNWASEAWDNATDSSQKQWEKLKAWYEN